MEINKFGIILESLTPETAEIVRHWRNDPEINKFMDFRQEISADQQKVWLEKIQKENSKYFLIRKDSLPIGMIHLENFDLKNRSAHVGLFVGDVNCHGTGLALSASLSILEYAFETLNLDSLFAKVKNDNIQAIEYNQFLGFEKLKDFNEYFSYWILTNARFRSKKEALLKYVTFL